MTNNYELEKGSVSDAAHELVLRIVMMAGLFAAKHQMEDDETITSMAAAAGAMAKIASSFPETGEDENLLNAYVKLIVAQAKDEAETFNVETFEKTFDEFMKAGKLKGMA